MHHDFTEALARQVRKQPPRHPDIAIRRELLDKDVPACGAYAPPIPFLPGDIAHPTRYRCSRDRDHDGQHVAGLDTGKRSVGRYIAEWDDNRDTDQEG